MAGAIAGERLIEPAACARVAEAGWRLWSPARFREQRHGSLGALEDAQVLIVGERPLVHHAQSGGLRVGHQLIG